MVRDGVKDWGQARGLAGGGAAWCGTSGERRGSLTPPRLEARSCAVPAMAIFLAYTHASVHVYFARRLHFSASSDGFLYWLSEECSNRGLRRVGELLDDLLTERQAEQPEPPLDPELEALLSF